MFLTIKKNLSLLEYPLFSFDVMSNGLTCMFLFGSVEAIFRDCLSYFNYDYRGLLLNPYNIKIKDIINFSSIFGFFFGCFIHPFFYNYVVTKYNLKY